MTQNPTKIEPVAKEPVKRKRRGTAKLWIAGLFVGAVVHGAGLLLLRVDPEVVETPMTDYSFANLPALRGGEFETELLREQAILEDSAPLFLPTRWNSASAITVEALDQRLPELFSLFPVRFSYGEADFGQGAIQIRNPVLNTSTLTTLDRSSRLPFGQEDTEEPTLGKRFAVVEAVRPGSRELMLSETVDGKEAPATGGQIWAPMEFLLHIENVGLIGDPVLLRGSGVEEIDSYLREATMELLHERMPTSGYFQITAGP